MKVAFPDGWKSWGPGTWFVLSGLLFAIMVAGVKWLGQTLPVPQLLFLRQLAVLTLLIPSILSPQTQCLRANRPGLNLLRGGISTAAMLAGFVAVVHLPLAESTTLNFMKVLFVVALAGAVLGERVSASRWWAMAAGLVGVAIIARPSATGFIDPMALLAVLAAFLAACNNLIVRRLAPLERTATMMLWQSAVVLIIVAGPGLWNWVTPTPGEWLIIALVGALMGGAQWTLIQAHRSAEASALSPLEYLRLIHASILGWILFGDTLSAPTLAGAALIIGAALWVQRAEKI
jgi:drug/metabolite transporter (DMT)-like permease